MMFNNVFNFGFSASIKDTNLEQFLSVIFCFACSFMSMSQSLFPSLYGTANFLAFVSLPWSFVSDDEDDEDDSVVAVEAEEDKTILTHFFCRLPRDVDVPRFPFDDKEEEEREGTEEKGARIAIVVVVVVVIVALFLRAFEEFWIKDASSLQNGPSIKSIFFFQNREIFFCLCHLSSSSTTLT